MAKRAFSTWLAGLAIVTLMFTIPSPAPALDKLKFGTPLKMSPNNYLPLLAGEEFGYFKQQGLDIEWIPFTGSSPMFRAVAAKSVNVGLAPTISFIRAAARSIPVIMIAGVTREDQFVLWVLADSPLRRPGDLKGAKIGLSCLGGTT